MSIPNNFRKPREIAFVLTDSNGKIEPAKRKLIRQHVMLGMNQGKSRHARPIASAAADGAYVTADVSTILSRSGIPPRLGTELSFTKFAASVEPELMHNVLQFFFTSKPSMYALETCIQLEAPAKYYGQWFQLLASDDAYMHASVWAVQSYTDFTNPERGSLATSRQALRHYSRTLQILQDRLSQSNTDRKPSAGTIFTVWTLANHARAMGDMTTLRCHMDGLRKLLDTKGGILNLDNTKMAIELMRIDLATALHWGTRPYFFNDTLQEPMISHDKSTWGSYRYTVPTCQITWEPSEPSLAETWRFLKEFCLATNSAVSKKQKLSKETLFNVLGSVLYRLISMENLKLASIDEAVRLGLLAFCTHVFLTWPKVPSDYTSLANSNRDCLLELRPSEQVPAQLILWLLIIGSISVFKEENESWLMPWMRSLILLCQGDTWPDLREQLKAFPWIDNLHEDPVRKVYERAMLN